MSKLLFIPTDRPRTSGYEQVTSLPKPEPGINRLVIYQGSFYFITPDETFNLGPAALLDGRQS